MLDTVKLSLLPLVRKKAVSPANTADNTTTTAPILSNVLFFSALDFLAAASAGLSVSALGRGRKPDRFLPAKAGASCRVSHS